MPFARSYTDEQLIRAVKDSYSLYATVKRLGLRPAGNSYIIARELIKRLGIDTSHFKRIYTPRKGARPLIDYLTNKAKIDSHPLKLRLVKEKILKWECSICGISEWQNKPIALELDHINGNHSDNSLENLRVLCPNCHSQTSNNRGKNKGKVSQVAVLPVSQEYQKFCTCGTQIHRTSNTCPVCSNGHKPKITWPAKEELEKLVWEKSVLQLSKEFGVTANAIVKRCKKFGIVRPSVGYWAKKYAGK